MSSRKLSMKLFVDKSTNKILFAEAGKETIDFLFGILTLPVARIISLLSTQGMDGCLPNLYQSVENMNQYLNGYQHKDILLLPKVHTLTQGSSLFKLTNVAKDMKRFYICNDFNNSDHRYARVTEEEKYACWECNKLMNTELTLVGQKMSSFMMSSGGVGGFVKGMVTYMVMDDLVVKPMSTASTIALLAKLNIKDFEAIEEKLVYLDADMGLKLLKTSFQSKNVLSSIFLPQENSSVAAVDT